MWKTAVIHTNVTFNQNVSQHVQIPCLKNQYAKNQIVCLITSWTIPLRKDKVKISHTKISHIFSRSKNPSTEPHNYPINLVLSVNKNFVSLWSLIFFLMLAIIFHKIWDFEKKILKNVKSSFLNRIITKSLKIVVHCILKLLFIAVGPFSCNNSYIYQLSFVEQNRLRKRW